MKSLLVIAIALTLSAVARADAPPAECPYNAAKFVPAFKAAVDAFLKKNLTFAWNESSLKVSCGKANESNWAAQEACNASFTAKDGTLFFLHDDVVTYTDQWGNQQDGYYSDSTISLNFIARQQATNDEGNYVGPITCAADINPPVVVNKKSGVELPLDNADFNTVTYAY